MTGKYKTVYFICITLLAVIVSISYSKITPDDEFIFYTYAKNISLGNGYTFNAGEKVNASTSPLYTLLLASFNYITGASGYEKIPLIGDLVRFISLLLLVYFAYKTFEKSRLKSSGYLFALLIAADPLFRNSAGMETQFSLMLLMAAVYFYTINRFELTGVFSALAVLGRFDNILIVIVILIHYLAVKKKLPGLKTILSFSAVLLPWFIFSFFYFGSILPTTFFIKTHQQSMGYWGSGLLFLKGFTTEIPGGIPVLSTMLLIMTISLVYLLLYRKEILRTKAFSILLGWSVLYFICYGFILNPPAYPWYYTFFVIPFGLLVSTSLDSFLSRFSEKYFLFVFLFIFCAGVILPVKTFVKPGPSKYDTYYQTAETLNKSAAGSKVLIDEIGIFGFYYNKGNVIDMLGLINPEIFNYLRKKDYSGIIQNYRPDYVIVDYPVKPVYEKFTESKDFLNSYYPYGIISGEFTSVEIFAQE